MNRQSLAPPRALRDPGLGRLDGRAEGIGSEDATSHARVTASGRAAPRRSALDPPLPARPRPRPLFDPSTGWFRRLEREVHQRLARHLYPRIPGIRLPYGQVLERQLSLSEATLQIEGLPRAFDGLRLMLLSDVHAGPFLSPRRLRRTFERLLELRPEAILIAGDWVTTGASELGPFQEAVGLLRAPLGVWSVLGNHDHYAGEAHAVRDALEQSGVRVLDNRATTLERNGQRLHLAGIDDLVLGQPDLERALAGTESPVILLSHNPDVLFEAARRGVALVLSGHTHAGQIRVPGLPVLVRQSRYRLDEGRYRVGPTELVVSRGLGAVGLPWRVSCPPEAVLLELRGKDT